MEIATVHPVQNPIMTSGAYGLNAIHLLRPDTGNAKGTLMVDNSIAVQQAAKLSIYSTDYGDIDRKKLFNHRLVSILERDTREKQLTSSLKALKAL